MNLILVSLLQENNKVYKQISIYIIVINSIRLKLIQTFINNSHNNKVF